MNRHFDGVLSGPEDFPKVCEFVKHGGAPVLIISASSPELLSNSTRELVREMRTAGARTEFHAPGAGDTIVQSTNRLLADIPIEKLTSRTEQAAPRLLVIDNGERLTEAETSSLGRIVNGLFGSALRVVAIVNDTPKRLSQLPIGNLGSLAVVWNLESIASDVIDSPAPSEVLKEIRATGWEKVSKASTPKVARSQADSDDIRDVLIELSKERAGNRSVDVTVRGRRVLPLVASLGAIAVLAAAVTLKPWLDTDRVDTRQYVFDCGLHPDRESTDTLLARLDRKVPTRVREQTGGYRLEVGPFEGQGVAETMRQQIWRLGACRVSPTVVRAETVKAIPRGG